MDNDTMMQSHQDILYILCTYNIEYYLYIGNNVAYTSNDYY